jgi:hypothetical protein
MLVDRPGATGGLYSPKIKTSDDRIHRVRRYRSAEREWR